MRLFSSFRIEQKGAYFFDILFMIRRFQLILILIFLVDDSPYLQIWCYLLLSLLQLTYVISVQPFEAGMLNLGEIVNESCVTLTAYHLFWFTDYVSVLESEKVFGWSLISLIVLCVTFNIVIFVITLVKYCRLRCKRYFAIKAAKKKLE